MFEGRRPIFFAVLLILAGIASYFLSDPSTYEDQAVYEVSHAKNGNWEHARISGADLNAQNPRDKALNQMVSICLVAGGFLVLGVRWHLGRKQT